MGAAAVVVVTTTATVTFMSVLGLIYYNSLSRRNSRNNCKSKRRLPSGLTNVGNSCYLNSVLQLLASAGGTFQNYLRTGSSPVSRELLELLQSIDDGEARVLRPDSFIGSFSNRAQTSGLSFEQQDAHEFLLALLNLPNSDKSSNAQSLFSFLSGPLDKRRSIYRAKNPFTGVLMNELVCATCAIRRNEHHISSMRVEPFSCVTLNSSISTVSEALHRQLYFSESYEDYTNYCFSGVKCGNGAIAHKRVISMPQLLFLHVSLLQSTLVKDESQLKLELSVNVSGFRYRLLGVIVHYGRDGSSGHFVCYRRFGKGRWIECNDERVRVVSVEEVLSQRAYLLLYQKEAKRSDK